MNKNDTHDYFLDPLKKKETSKKERLSVFLNGRNKKLKKIEDMLRLFGAPEDNIEFLKCHFYKENDIRII